MSVTTSERRRDAQRTRQNILDVARREFAERGYSGARVDHIAARTRTTKRMIYYYFGGKEQLFEAVLEQAYSEIRAPPSAAWRRSPSTTTTRTRTSSSWSGSRTSTRPSTSDGPRPSSA